MVVDVVNHPSPQNLKNEMSKQKAFVRYTKNGRIIPGSLIMSYDYPKPGLWAQVLTNICCDQDVPGIISTTPKAWVRYTKQGKLVPGSLVIGDSYPESGIWKEVIINLCCTDIITTTSTTTTTTAPPTEVTIGGQIWSRFNLNVDTYRNGDPIPEVQDPVVWSTLTTGAWCYYNNDPANGAIYGKLYNWYAVNDPRGLAPTGWHVPSDFEWFTVTNIAGGTTSGGSGLKQVGTTYWANPNIATDLFNFRALPGGFRSSGGSFNGINTNGNWWAANPAGPLLGITYGMFHNTAVRYVNNYPKKNGYSVRLIKD